MTTTITSLSQSQIQSLLTAETQQLEQPITTWQNQIKADQAQISAWGQIGGALTSLSSATGAIQDPTTFNNRGASSSDTSVAVVSAAAGAALGTYQLTNVQPAQAQSIYSGAYASTTTSLGSGSGALTFTLAGGGTETVSVASGDATLEGVASAINAASGGGVTASVVGGSSGYRLVLTGATTGANSAFSVSGTGSLSGLAYVFGGASNTFTQATAASDASLNINGVPVTDSTNTLTQAIPGVTLTLAGAGSADVSVSVNSDTLSTAVSTVVSGFNSAMAAIQSATAFGGVNSSNGNGPLLGNFSATDLATQLGSAVSTLSSGGLSARDIGITFNKDGSLSFDSGAFASAYASNPDTVNGLVSELSSQVSSVTQPAIGSSTTGTVAEQTNALNQSVTGINQEISQETVFINQQIQNSASQFSELINAQSKYSTWNSYLDAIFSGSSGSGG